MIISDTKIEVGDDYIFLEVDHINSMIHLKYKYFTYKTSMKSLYDIIHYAYAYLYTIKEHFIKQKIIGAVRELRQEQENELSLLCHSLNYK